MQITTTRDYINPNPDLCAYCLQVAAEPYINNTRINTVFGERIKEAPDSIQLPNRIVIRLQHGEPVNAEMIVELARLFQPHDITYTMRGGQTLPLYAVTFWQNNRVCWQHVIQN